MLESERRQVATWLLICCALVFAMVVLGGVTRLTGSGLSMVRWEPISGIIPPLNEAEWQKEFEHYQLSPEYQKINFHMDLEAFQGIFWFEFAHRILGRTIGFVFLVPFLFFLVFRKFDRSLIPKLLLMFALGGLQGLLGWYMVKSGLVDNPHVSQYRLTAHLAAAIVIYGYMLWVALDLLKPPQPSLCPKPSGSVRYASLALTGLIFVTILSGGFVAGSKAGYAYNTFPLMAGKWIPDDLFVLNPVYKNLFENVTTIQFDHRVLATLVLFSTLAFWTCAMRQRLEANMRLGVHLLLASVVVQFSLGVGTLLLRVPVALAATHQGVALVVFTTALFVLHALHDRRSAQGEFVLT